MLVLKGLGTVTAKKLIMEWPARAKGLQRKVAHRAAELALERINEKLPNKPEWKTYRESLELAEVGVTRSQGDAFMVRANPKARNVRNVDSSDMLLYVQGHKRLKRVPEKIRILERYGPWTVQTLPFTPERSYAKIISRKVSKKEADKVTKRRLREKHKWRTELAREGVRPIPIRSKEAKVIATVPDVAFEAMRMEFGIGQKPQPHWRPAVSYLARNGGKDIMRAPQMKAALSDASFTGWKQWGKISLSKKIAVGEAKKLMSFQKRLGIRVGK